MTRVIANVISSLSMTIAITALIISAAGLIRDGLTVLTFLSVIITSFAVSISLHSITGIYNKA